MIEAGSAIAVGVVYGFLVLFIFMHLIGRWRWRKRKLTRFFPHIVGDKSFKCKHMRQRLGGDFAFIAAISPDPRLVNASLHPSAFGGKESDTPPCHWYRMKTFDLAADFVATHRRDSRGKENVATIPLDQLLTSLASSQSWLPEQESIIKCCKELYTLARYQAGVFGKDEFDEFHALLQQVKQLVSTDVDSLQQSFGRSVSNQAMVEAGDLLELSSVQSLHSPLTSKSSKEPLLTLQKVGSKKTASSSATRKPSIANKPFSTELSPLVLDTDSQAFRRSSSPSVEMTIPSPSSVTSTTLDH